MQWKWLPYGIIATWLVLASAPPTAFAADGSAAPSITELKQAASTLSWRKLRKSVVFHWAWALRERALHHPPAPWQGFRALLQTHRPLRDAERKALEAQGLRFVSDAAPAAARFYPIVLLHTKALATLEAHPLVAQVDANGPAWTLKRPIAITAKLVQTYETHQRKHNGINIRGNGVTIGIMDSGVDVFHPTLFRADGGTFAWIDADGDGAFTPGNDAIDFNNNGKADGEEFVKCHHGRMISQLGFINDPPTQCRIGLDWLYLDLNDNGKRDFGPQDGFQETDPGYGEPIFVFDDANRNRRVDIGEKFLLLKTSKIKAVHIGGVVRERGKDLIHTPVIPTLNGSGHGTMTSSVLVGGPSRDTWCRGIAPDAELLISNQGDGTTQAWMMQQKPDLLLHQYGAYVGQFLDGSSNLEQAIDAAGKQGMIQLAGAGNLAGGDKHFAAKVAPTQGTTITMPLGRAAGSSLKYQQLLVTLLWRGKADARPSFALVLPDGSRYPLAGNNDTGKQIAPGVMAASSLDRSNRGTNMMLLGVFGQDTEQNPLDLPQGDWKLEITGDPKEALTIHGYVADDLSDWAGGVFFTDHVTKETTITWPATSDTVISVAAVAGRADLPYTTLPEQVGQLRGYSSQGPRIDGALGVWIAAPDNPLSAISAMVVPGFSSIGLGQYFVYGGTSSTGPHVAGAVALLKQLHPDWAQAQVKEALRKGAGRPKREETIPNNRWGHGGLLIHRTLFGTDPAPPGSGCGCELRPSQHPAGGMLLLVLLVLPLVLRRSRMPAKG